MRTHRSAGNALAVDYADPPELLDLVEDLRHGPADDGLRAVLAAMLAGLGPSRVKAHRFPPWLRPCWSRLVRRLDRDGHGPLSNWELEGEVQHALYDLRPGHAWDHWGIARIAGLACLVTEPYGYPGAEAAALMRPLAALLPGCAHAWAARGAWFTGTSRGILFPPLVMPQPKRRRRSDAKARGKGPRRVRGEG